MESCNCSRGKKEVIEFWDRSRFKNRSIKIWSSGREVEEFPIPDEEIICDICIKLIEEENIPVLNDSYALCLECYENQKEEICF